MSKTSRDGRLQFAACGLPCALNVVGLFMHGMGAAFKGGKGAHIVWLDGALLLACLGILLLFAVRRGHDLGWPTGATAAGSLLALGMPPLWLVMIGVMLAMPAQPTAERYGPAPAPSGAGIWLGSALLLAWPWALVLPVYAWLES